MDRRLIDALPLIGKQPVYADLVIDFGGEKERCEITEATDVGEHFGVRHAIIIRVKGWRYPTWRPVDFPVFVQMEEQD